MLQRTRARARKLGIPFDLSRKWLSNVLDDGLCQITGIPFAFESRNGRPNPFAPSIDQIEPARGYVHGNVRVVVWLYNAAKNAWTHADVLRMARALSNQFPEAN